MSGNLGDPWNLLFSTPKTGSPIILDLTGDGVTTTSINAGTFFDLRNSGFAEKTGWVAPTDGLLVWDRNGNGVIDNGGELFGNFTQKADGTAAANGFDALASYDANKDGKIDASDPIWNSLKIWVDANGNGVTDSGELHALSDFGIKALNLAYTNYGTNNPNSVDASGNYQQCTGTYTTTAGKTMAMNDVFFVNDTTQTVSNSWVATTAAIDALPDLQTQGTLYSLHQAMARDASGKLQSLVTQFVAATTISARNALMEQILIYWAGAQNVSPTSRNANNANFNAQHLAVLEAAMGRPYTFSGSPSSGSSPTVYSVAQLTSAYKLFSERMYAQLAAQTFLKPYFDLIATVTDSNGTHFDFTAALASLFGSSMTHDKVVEFYRTVFASGLIDAQVNYAGLLSTLAAKAPSYVAEVNQLVAPYYAYNLTTPIAVNGTTYPVDPLSAPMDGATVVGGLGGATINANSNSSGSVRGTTVYGNAGTNTINASGNLGTQQTMTADRIYGGTGNDTIHYTYTLPTGTIVDGGAGNNALVLDGGSSDITQATISNIQSLVITTGFAKMTSAQFNSFASISSPNAGEIDLTTGGVCSLIGKGGAGITKISAQNAAGNFTITGGDQNNLVLIGGLGTNVLTVGNGAGDTLYAGSLYGGTGSSTLNAGNGAGDILYAGSANDILNAGSGGDTLYDGAGVTTLNGGSGNDTFRISHGKAGSSVKGNGGSDTLYVTASDISGVSVSGVSTLDDESASLKISLSAFNAFSTIKNGSYGSVVYNSLLYVTDAGTYSLAGKTATGCFNLDASQTTANVTLIGNNQNGETLRGGSGIDTLTAGNGTGDILYAGSGNTTMNAGTGNETLNGSSAYNTYKFGSVFGQDTINNGGGAAAHGEIDFGTGVTDELLWLKRSGNDLIVQLLGTSDQVDIAGWYNGTAGNQVQSFNAGGLKLDTQVAQMVQAMASFQSANPGFNAATATAMPTDTSLQSVIAASWHH